MCIGRLKAGPERELCKLYEKRFNALGRQLGLKPLNIIEVPESRCSHVSARQDEEARTIFSKCRQAALVVLLDEQGEDWTSARFAGWIGEQRHVGTSEICFFIGGPDGHGKAARSSAGRSLNLGQLTLSHGLARVVLSEQLYRAATILAGHPYHRV